MKWTYTNQFTEKERIDMFSAYKDKFMRRDMRCRKKPRQQIVKAYRPQDYKPTPSLSLFNIIPERDVPRDRHWRQYEKLCHPCVINYDFKCFLVFGHLMKPSHSFFKQYLKFRTFIHQIKNKHQYIRKQEIFRVLCCDLVRFDRIHLKRQSA